MTAPIAVAGRSDNPSVSNCGQSIRMASLAAVFVVATLLSAGYICGYLLAKGPKTYTSLQEEPKIARHLALGHGFLSPLDPSPNAPPTSWAPPLYPFLMAAVYRVAGVQTRASLNILFAINALSFGAILAAVVWLGSHLYNRLTGYVAAILVTVHPVFLLRTVYFWDSFVGLAIFAWLLVAAVAMGRAKPKGWHAALLGLLMAIASLVNVTYTLAYPVIVLAALRQVRAWRWFRMAAMILAFFVLGSLPWTIRNYQQFGRLIFVRGGGVMELWVGNIRGQSGWVTLDHHPSIDKQEGNLMLSLGENKYFDLCRDRFDAEYQRDPGAYWRRCVNRVFYVCLGNPFKETSITLVQSTGRLAAIGRISLDACVFVMGLIGTFIAWRRGCRSGWVMIVAVLCAVPFLITHVEYRYVMPIRLLFLLNGALCISACWTRWKTGSWTPQEQPLQ